MNITDVTQRQFEKLLERQGKTVIDISSGKEYKVLFSKSGATNMQDKIKISYVEDCPLVKGSIIEYKKNYYILINQDNIESDVYISSIAIKTNCTWFINGKYYHLVAGELSGASPKFGARTNQVSGTVALYTTKSNIIGVDECVVDFGGAYKCVNKFTIDNLTHYYFSRELMNTDAWGVSLGTKGGEIENGTELQLTPSMTKRGWYIPSDNLVTRYTYTSSDETVATVDYNGLVRFIGTGSVTITCEGYMSTGEVSVWAEGSVNFTSVMSGQPYATVECFAKDTNSGKYTLPVSDGNHYSYARDYQVVVHYFDEDSVEDTTAVPVSWDIDDSLDFVSPVYIEGDDTYAVEYRWDDADGASYVPTLTITTSGNTMTVDVPANSRAKALYYNPIKITANYSDGTSVTYTSIVTGSI